MIAIIIIVALIAIAIVVAHQRDGADTARNNSSPRLVGAQASTPPARLPAAPRSASPQGYITVAQPRVVATTRPSWLGTCLGSGLRLRVTLEYVDTDGVATRRDVQIEELYGRHGDRSAWSWVNWIVGYCYLRQERRHFNVKNIRSIRLANSDPTFTTDAVEPWLATMFRVRRTRDMVEPITCGTSEVSFVWLPQKGEAEAYRGFFEEITAAGGHVFGARFDGMRDATSTRKARSGAKVFDFSKGRIKEMRIVHRDLAIPDPLDFLHRVATRGSVAITEFILKHPPRDEDAD